MKPLVLTSQAESDLEQAFNYYFDVANLVVAENFCDAVNAALRHLTQHPGTGSTRYARQGDATPLRFWTLNRFPSSIFYIEQANHIDVLRVLHQASDLPHHLT